MRLPGGNIGADLASAASRVDEFLDLGEERSSHGLEAQFPLHGLRHSYRLAIPARRTHRSEIAIDCLSHHMICESWRAISTPSVS